MEKKTRYWPLAILAIVVIGAILWGASSSQTTTQDPAASTAPSQAGSVPLDHENMDHGSMGHVRPDVSAAPDDPNLAGYLEEEAAIMATMMDGMMGIERSDNAAIDFLAGMIPHHQSAIEMADSYLNYGGSHEVLAPLAQDIITTQTNEIQQMQTMISSLKMNGIPDPEQADAYWDAYTQLMDHPMSHSSASSLDEAFATGMILHHQMAVDMANAIIPHTNDEPVRQLAQTIVDTQEQEIGDMQSVLNELQASR